MDIINSPIPGCYVLQPDIHSDPRGSLVKTYNEKLYFLLGKNFEMVEEFFSISKKNVIRGMHFQLPPHDHDKLVFCMNGAVLDIVLDLRVGNGYGKFSVIELSEINRHILFIPKGVAHGFLAKSEEATMIYKTNALRLPEHESGILWNSFGYEWGIRDPILSERDQQLECLLKFNSPFVNLNN